MIYTDVATGERTRKIRAHRGIINTLDRTMGGGAGVELVATGSDDGTVKVWEGGHEASKQPVATFEFGCPVTAVCWSADGSNLYIGALDNEIHVCTCSLIAIIFGLTQAPFRSTIFASKPKYQHCPVILTPQPRLRSPPMDLSSFLPPSRHKLSSTMLGRSPHLRHGYIEYSRAPLRVSKTRYSREHGAKTMVDSALPLEVLTGQLPFGTSRVRRFFIRFDLTSSRLIKAHIRLSAAWS